MDPIHLFKEEILNAINSNQLTLPSQPEVALQIRDATQNKDISVKQLADIISQDAGISARLLQIANSPAQRSLSNADTLLSAINRLGLVYVCNIASGLAMEQIFQATNETVDKLLRETWDHSKQVAAICQVLAMHYTKISPDQALLAGLLHEIGILPILTYAEENNKLLEDPKILNKIIAIFHPGLGSYILKQWNFPEDITLVPKNYLKFDRDSFKPNQPDLVDVVTAANLQSRSGTEHFLAKVDWSQVKAFERLGLEASTETPIMEDLSEEFTQALQAFN